MGHSSDKSYLLDSIMDRIRAYKHNIDILTRARTPDPKNISDLSIRVEELEYIRGLINKADQSNTSNFTIGSWVIHKDGFTGQIIFMHCDNSIYVSDGTSVFCDNMNNFYNWTLDDSIDGDILINANGEPFIFNGEFNTEIVGSYCRLIGANYKLLVTESRRDWVYNKNIRPALQVERNLLFKILEDNGYYWDPIHKSLFKLNFKVGDVVTNGKSTFQITSIKDGIYWSHYNTVGIDIDSMNTEYHLWTQEDIKVGDVLVSKQPGNEGIFIHEYRDSTKKLSLSKVVLSNKGRFKVFQNGSNKVFKLEFCEPANNEQITKLERKLYESGYTWFNNTINKFK